MNDDPSICIWCKINRHSNALSLCLKCKGSLVKKARNIRKDSKKRGSRVSLRTIELFIILYNQNFQCKFCEEKDELTADHIVPICIGGKTTYKNMQLLCRSCHDDKDDKFSVFYFNDRKVILSHRDIIKNKRRWYKDL